MLASGPGRHSKRIQNSVEHITVPEKVRLDLPTVQTFLPVQFIKPSQVRRRCCRSLEDQGMGLFQNRTCGDLEDLVADSQIDTRREQ